MIIKATSILYLTIDREKWAMVELCNSPEEKAR